MRSVISRCGGVLLAFVAGFVDTATFLAAVILPATLVALVAVSQDSDRRI
jgi:hypothetical protein